MGKASRRKQARKDLPEGVESVDPAVQALTQRNQRRRIVLLLTPLLTTGAAFASWHLLESEVMTGVAALLGAGTFIITLLNKLNDEIRPSDGSRAASIDFGNSR